MLREGGDVEEGSSAFPVFLPSGIAARVSIAIPTRKPLEGVLKMFKYSPNLLFLLSVS